MSNPIEAGESTSRQGAEEWLDNHPARELVETMRHPLLVLDRGLRVRLTNEKFRQIFQVTREETTGKLLFELGDHEWNVPELRALFDEVLGRREHLEQLEIACNFARAGRRNLVITVRRMLRGAEGPPELLLVAIEDVTELRNMMQTVLELESRMQAVVHTAPDAVITIDEQGRMETVNPAVERMFGYSAAELIGRNVSTLMPTPFREAHNGYLQNYLETGVARIIGVGREVQGLRKDGTVFPMDLGVSEFRRGNHRGFAGILRDASQRKELEREIVEIAVREQRRIGQDLHDSTGQELTGLGFLAYDLAERLREEGHPLSAKAQRLVAGLDRVLGQVRRFSRGLAPVNVDADGLRAALTRLAGDIRADTGIACTVTHDPRVEIRDNAVASHLFRIAQEAVSNAVRYAQPQSIRLSLTYDDHNAVRLCIEDDGAGIADLKQARASGLGLRIMNYRAELIGGTLQIQTAQPGGTRVSCTLPRNPNDDATISAAAGPDRQDPAGR
ncbi:MAG: PAS domain S-box protein [Planctomycetaceae bacterium]|nr:PAS domain S-box protein [Planctomycetaceae bacterium]